MKAEELRKDTAERIVQYFNSEIFKQTKEWDVVGQHIIEFLESHESQYRESIIKMIDEKIKEKKDIINRVSINQNHHIVDTDIEEGGIKALTEIKQLIEEMK